MYYLQKKYKYICRYMLAFIPKKLCGHRIQLSNVHMSYTIWYDECLVIYKERRMNLFSMLMTRSIPTVQQKYWPYQKSIRGK